MKKPYAISDFEKLMLEGYYYVDRTDRIPFREQTDPYLLFLRPLRFGKSLWLSVLKNYYDLAKADLFEQLFGKLFIGKKTHRFIISISLWNGISPVWTVPVPLMTSGQPCFHISIQE